MANSPSNHRRRALLHATAAAAISQMMASAPAEAEPAKARPIPKGKAGEFDFLSGNWKVQHRRLKAPGQWDEFEGEATCWSILEGICSIEELRIPARNFSGMGLRLLDAKKALWSDHWVNAKFGVLTTPGTLGGFTDGVGTFLADDNENGKPITVRGVWDLITPASCRWHQATSRDRGKTWEENWVMDWKRV